MTVATRAEAPHFEVEGYEFHPLAVPSRGSKELAVWSISAAPGASSTPHQHDREVVFIVTTGQMTGSIGGETFQADPGDAIIVPAHTDFTLGNASPTEPASLTVSTTAGMQAIVEGNSLQPPWSM
ncbi:cupin domain-containing protein [Kibdelosporangium philippinense]|uniref:Cupin domain-containing protein n=1 Tax=Kibdelosporangium philippinense TaxID=211113 RepID=A0ABS8ZYT9_9PSEU|nr:cupin domain-containing protein [Kibdelosporangium philippinense]MCE7012116.1 cupin domain-containing protein [Kibdelosporangium philippinense]